MVSEPGKQNRAEDGSGFAIKQKQSDKSGPESSQSPSQGHGWAQALLRHSSGLERVPQPRWEPQVRASKAYERGPSSGILLWYLLCTTLQSDCACSRDRTGHNSRSYDQQ